MDFTKLEKELSGLMQKDDKYWRENDAKFRAAKQMATYEEFENIVKVSLLFGLEYLHITSHLISFEITIFKVIKQIISNILGISFEATREVRSRAGNVSRWC